MSKEYGQLGLAMEWLRGQESAAGAQLLLPEELHAVNRGTLRVPVEVYRNANDVLRAVEASQPSLVMFFSAYNLDTDGLLSRDALSAVLEDLRRRGCQVVTSDPFLGLAPELSLGQIDTRMATVHLSPAWWRWSMRLLLPFQGNAKKVVRVPNLDGVPHLYPTPVPSTDDGVTRLSFFNPAILAAPTGDRSAGGDGNRDRSQRPRWLFVLSDSDVACQGELIGLKAFTQHLVAMLRYTEEVERHAILVAPPPIANRIATELPETCEAVPFCPFPDFERRLLDAEYAFFWSAFSFSQLIRVANELPIFLFDQGLFARTLRPIGERARAWYYGGWEPPMLDQRQLFSGYVLAHLAKTQLSAMQTIRRRWQSSPAPDVLVRQSLTIGALRRSD